MNWIITKQLAYKKIKKISFDILGNNNPVNHIGIIPNEIIASLLQNLLLLNNWKCLLTKTASTIPEKAFANDVANVIPKIPSCFAKTISKTILIPTATKFITTGVLVSPNA